ncbi:MAG: P-type conjugative transfer protein TrbL [Gallionella sp.]|nr:P-type conjugative transfer protein TrbL [Gallionella sp.]
MKTIVKFFLFVAGLLLFTNSFADSAFTVPDYASLPVSPTSVLDKINNDYSKLVPKWGNTIQAFAVKLFWELVLVDFTWTTIVWVKDRKEIGEILMGYVGKIISIGFFWSLLKLAGDWIPSIISSFVKIGQDASGAGVALTPDGIFAMSLTVVFDMYGAMADLGVTDRIAVSFGIAIAAVLVVVGFAMIAGQLLVTLIESYVAIGGGVILLGFGGSRWTTDMASSYLKFAVGSGIKLMLCYLVIGAGLTMFTLHFPPVDAATNGIVKIYIVQALAIGGEALVFVYLAFTIPGLASAMMSGSPNMSVGGMVGAGITAAAGVAGAGAAAQALGGAKLAGAAGEAVKGALPGNGPMQAVNMNPLNGGGGGGNGVLPPGSGLSPTSSGNGSVSAANMPGAPKTGALAASFADSTASPMAASTPVSQDGRAATYGASASPQGGSTSAPAMSSGGINLGTSPNAAKAAVAASSGSSESAGGPGGGAAPAGSTAVSGASSATAASVAAADPHTALLTSISENMAKMANGPENSPALHDKISSMQKFVPNDGATIQTPGISMGHTRD